MGWYLNRYVCPVCKYVWSDEWSAMSDDTCPDCECSDISPVDSDDLSVITSVGDDGDIQILVSNDQAHEYPMYSEILCIPAQTIIEAKRRPLWDGI